MRLYHMSGNFGKWCYEHLHNFLWDQYLKCSGNDKVSLNFETALQFICARLW